MFYLVYYEFCCPGRLWFNKKKSQSFLIDLGIKTLNQKLVFSAPTFYLCIFITKDKTVQS